MIGKAGTEMKPSSSEHWDRTAPTLESAASTSMINCLLVSGWMRIGVLEKCYKREAESASADHWEGLVMDMSLVRGAASRL